MMRLAPRHCACVGALVLLALAAGCGGESSVTAGVPIENMGPVVSGQVSMPNGTVAAAPGPLERLAARLVAAAHALVAADVQPVGSGVLVRLVRIGPDDIQNGRIVSGLPVFETTTRADGSYSVRLPTETTIETCRFYLEVGDGSAGTLTRAFVDATTVDIDFESEAAMRLLLDEIGAGRAQLCNLDAADLRSVRGAVEDSPQTVSGATAAALNTAATVAAAMDPTVRAALALATGQPTPPAATHTAPPTLTPTGGAPTATVPVGPTATNTALPTRTPTSEPSATSTELPTRTATPTAESTQTTVPTNTTAPTHTATTVPTQTVTHTPVATGTGVPTSTPTVPMADTPTATATPTGTPAQAALLDLGSATGTAGAVVEIVATLVAGSEPPAAVATDITFATVALSVVEAGGMPDCTLAAGVSDGKTLVASVVEDAGTTRLRVGVIGLDNNETLSSGPLFACRFQIAADAVDTIELTNLPEAADASAQPLAISGRQGSITVVLGPPTLGLATGTAAAVGATVEITATLAPNDAELAAVSSEIRFDAARLSAVLAGDMPDCTASAAAAALGKEVVASLLAADGEGRAGLRVGVIGLADNTPLPAGPLFTCRVRVESGGGDITLLHDADGASPGALPVDVLGEPGTITVP